MTGVGKQKEHTEISDCRDPECGDHVGSSIRASKTIAPDWTLNLLVARALTRDWQGKFSYSIHNLGYFIEIMVGAAGIEAATPPGCRGKTRSDPPTPKSRRILAFVGSASQFVVPQTVELRGSFFNSARSKCISARIFIAGGYEWGYSCYGNS